MGRLPSRLRPGYSIVATSETDAGMPNYAIQRRHMVDSQLRTNKVTDPALLEAMGAVPRERFVTAAQRGIAYIDVDLAIGNGRALLEPMVFARLLQSAGIGPRDVVLDIGCATGYSTAVVARLAKTVIGLESEAALAGEASAALAELGVVNAMVMSGPLEKGWPRQAPYDAIIVEGAVDELPEDLLAQLGEGGRLVAVIRDSDGVGRATMVARRAGILSRRALFDAASAPLAGFRRRPTFVF